MITPMNETYYTYKQVAERFGVHVDTVRRWCYEGKLDYIKRGKLKTGAVRISLSAIERFTKLNHRKFIGNGQGD